MNLSNKIVTSFWIAGGLGYISYFVLEMTGVISSEETNSSKVTFLSLLFSLPNYLVYYFFQNKLKWNIFVSLSLTILIAILLTYLLGKLIVYLVFLVINVEKTHTINTGLDLGQPWTAIKKEKLTLVYLYSLDHKLIACGFGKNFSSNGNSVNIYADKQFETGVSSYEDVIKCAYKKKETDKSKRDSKDVFGSPIKKYLCYDSSVHINLKKSFIMIIFNVEEKDDKEPLDEHKTQ